MWDTQISALLSSPTVSGRVSRHFMPSVIGTSDKADCVPYTGLDFVRLAAIRARSLADLLRQAAPGASRPAFVEYPMGHP